MFQNLESNTVMLTIKSMLQTVKTTKNSMIVMQLRLSKKKKKVISQNGFEAELSLPENKGELIFFKHREF
jgi:hypothetical protein